MNDLFRTLVRSSVLPAVPVWNLGRVVVGEVVAHCWALRNQAAPGPTLGGVALLWWGCPALVGWGCWFLVVSFAAVCPGGWVVGVGGRAVCEVNSGREHLAAGPLWGVCRIVNAAACRALWVGCGCCC